MRSATRSADMPGPGSRFGHDVTMRQRCVCARATDGAAIAPARPRRRRAKRLRRVKRCSWSAPTTRHENDASARGPCPICELDRRPRSRRSRSPWPPRTASARSSPLARPAAIADDSVQPVPCVFAVSMRSAARRATASARPAGRRFPAPCAWPPLISTALRAEREQPLGLLAHLGFVARQRPIEQRGGLGQVGRDDRARAESARACSTSIAAGASSRSPDVAIITGSSTTCVCFQRSSPAATAAIATGCDSMPIFTALTSRSENTASICAAMKCGRHVVDRR